MTILDVAEHLQVSWDTVKDIQARSLQRRFGKPKLHKLTQIAIDEIAVGKGHHYLTVVLNLLTGAVVFVGDGKGVEALTPFWRRVRRARARIVAVADSFNAMVGRRPHREPITAPEAFERLRLGSETQFDPAIVSALGSILGAR